MHTSKIEENWNRIRTIFGNTFTSSKIDEVDTTKHGVTGMLFVIIYVSVKKPIVEHIPVQ